MQTKIYSRKLSGKIQNVCYFLITYSYNTPYFLVRKGKEGKDGKDDVGFIEHILEEIKHQWCIDLDHMHYSGVSNGGMFAWYIAATAKDALGKLAYFPIFTK